MKDDLMSFLMSAGLISLSVFIPISPLFSVAGIVGCGMSIMNIADEFIHRKDENIFRNCGLINKDKIAPKLIKKSETNEKMQMIYNLPDGLSIEDIRNKLPAINQAFKMPFNARLNCDYTFTLEYIKGVTYVDYKPCKTKPYELALSGNIKVNMNKFPHMLIGGDTGSGKSRLLFTILTNIIQQKDNTELHLLQVRKNDLGVFRNCKQVKAFSKNIDEILDDLIQIDEKLGYRESLIDNFKGIYNIEDYNNRRKGKALPYIYVVIDEFSFLNINRSDSKTDRTIKRQCLKHIKSIVSVGRSSGVFLITSLQKPTADSIPSDIKSQLVTRVSLHIQDTPTSIVVLGDDKATHLREREMAVKTNKTEFDYTYTINHNTIMKYIKDSVIHKPKKSKPQKKEATLTGKVKLL